LPIQNTIIFVLFFEHMFPPEKEMQTGSIKKPISRIFLMLAAPIYHARWLAAPVHLCVIKAIEMLASSVPM
jgi:hypothetical protein